MKPVLKVADFDYELPSHRIAQQPVLPSHDARLLVSQGRDQALTHTQMLDLPRWLNPGDLLIVNDTRVWPARLTGQRLPGGGKAELVLLQLVGDWPEQDGGQVWDCLAKPGRRLSPGIQLSLARGQVTGRILQVLPDGGRRVGLAAADGSPLLAVIKQAGDLPQPPYIERSVSPEEYQTMFARHDGSLAAPTAGLHFTPQLLAAVQAAGADWGTVTLHVGPGTFLPVRTDQVAQHRLPPEEISVGLEVIRKIAATRRAGGRIIAVGTTVARALETAAYFGWDGLPAPFSGETDLFIYPGYQFQIVDGLLTNFHLPRSTLLMLLCAFAGRGHVLAAYDEALAAGYRFASLGDASLWLAPKKGGGP